MHLSVFICRVRFYTDETCMWWARQAALIMPLNRIQRQWGGGIHTSSKVWATALSSLASSRGTFTFSWSWAWTCLCHSHWGGLEKASSWSVRPWLQRQRTCRSKFLGRNVLGCRWETGSHPRKAELVEMSGYKPGKLLRQVTHVWNGAKDMNGNYFSIVAKTWKGWVNKYLWLSAKSSP